MNVARQNETETFTQYYGIYDIINYSNLKIT